MTLTLTIVNRWGHFDEGFDGEAKASRMVEHVPTLAGRPLGNEVTQFRRQLRGSITWRGLSRLITTRSNPILPFMSVRRQTYAAFFDASGKPKPEDVLFVSGFVSTEEKWLRFDDRWKALMLKWGIKKPFHTTYYVSAHGSDYARFRNNDAERIAFEAEAIPIIKVNTNKPFSFGISIDDYNEAHRQYAFAPGFDRPYSLGGFAVIGALLKWSARQKAAGRLSAIKIIFEEGDDDRGVFTDAMQREYGDRPLLLPKDDLSPFVTGDILAWRHRRLLKRRSLAEKGHSCFAGLFKQLPHDSCQFVGKKETFELALRFGKPET